MFEALEYQAIIVLKSKNGKSSLVVDAKRYVPSTRDSSVLKGSSRPLEIFKIVLCGKKRKDSNENIKMNNPSIDRKLTFYIFRIFFERCFLPHSTILNLSRKRG